ncbi:MAG: AsmA family protein [Planctomycetaceae bacterium]|jgi:hypothetical protein|nr:AsmA family protein [Planctomycetaceae bacterium]
MPRFVKIGMILGFDFITIVCCKLPVIEIPITAVFDLSYVQRIGNYNVQLQSNDFMVEQRQVKWAFFVYVRQFNFSASKLAITAIPMGCSLLDNAKN